MKTTYVFISLIVSLCFSSCNTEKEEKETATKFIVTSPLKQDTTIIREYVCQIHSFQHIDLRALEKGYLEKIYIDEGQRVKKGQLLFKIMPLIYNAELQKAEAEAEYTEIEYKNTKQLHDKNVVSANELALAKAKYNKAKAEVQLAKVHLNFTNIEAPFDGIMGHLEVRLGSLIDEGDLLSTLSDNSQMWVYFNVPEAEYLNYKSNTTKENLLNVKLLMANNQLFNYPGEVKVIESDFNNETGNIAFRATFPNPNGLLRHGETGNIQMTIPLKNAIIIPQKATFEILEKKYVYVVDKNNIAHSREIQIESEMPDLYVVKKGISSKDKIILEGIRKVSEGQKIVYKYENIKSVLPKLKIYVE